MKNILEVTVYLKINIYRLDKSIENKRMDAVAYIVGLWKHDIRKIHTTIEDLERLEIQRDAYQNMLDFILGQGNYNDPSEIVTKGQQDGES